MSLTGVVFPIRRNVYITHNNVPLKDDPFFLFYQRHKHKPGLSSET